MADQILRLEAWTPRSVTSVLGSRTFRLWAIFLGTWGLEPKVTNLGQARLSWELPALG